MLSNRKPTRGIAGTGDMKAMKPLRAIREPVVLAFTTASAEAALPKALDVMGNCVATVVVARWEGVFDDEKMRAFSADGWLPRPS